MREEPLFVSMTMDYNLYRFGRVLEAVNSKSNSSLKGKQWLDLGCHNGTFARLLFEHGVFATGVDAYSLELKTENTWEYVQHDLDTGIIPFANQTFDIVSAMEIIEHITDTDKFLDEIFRVLKPDGLLVITTPNICMLKNRLRVPLGMYPYGCEYRNLIHHVRPYNLACLSSHLKGHGFRIVLSRGENLLPHKLVILASCFMKISELLSEFFPSLCSNLVVVCVKHKMDSV